MAVSIFEPPEHVIQRAVLLCSAPTLSSEDVFLPHFPQAGEEEIVPFHEFERRYLLRVFEKTTRGSFVLYRPTGTERRLPLE